MLWWQRFSHSFCWRSELRNPRWSKSAKILCCFFLFLIYSSKNILFCFPGINFDKKNVLIKYDKEVAILRAFKKWKYSNHHRIGLSCKGPSVFCHVLDFIPKKFLLSRDTAAKIIQEEKQAPASEPPDVYVFVHRAISQSKSLGSRRWEKSELSNAQKTARAKRVGSCLRLAPMTSPDHPFFGTGALCVSIWSRRAEMSPHRSTHNFYMQINKEWQKSRRQTRQ